MRMLLSATLLALLGASEAISQTVPTDQWTSRNGIPDGWKIVEGDIVVPENSSTTLGPWIADLWPGGVVPCLFSSNVSASRQALATAALDEWESIANVSFIPRTTETDYILIRDSSGDPFPGNNSAVGRIGGQQIINIVSWGNHYIIMHEAAHTLGFYHEQSRTDRDSYIDINYGNIDSTGCSGGPCDHNFDIRFESDLYGPYDFDSVMHYGQYFFSDNGLPTITVLPPNAAEWQDEIGQRDHLSLWDSKIMSFLYAQPEWVFCDPTSFSPFMVGSFRAPFFSFSNALAFTPSGGTLFVLQPFTIDVGSGLVLDKEMELKAPLGGVVLR